MTPLRQRMTDDMRIRNFALTTQRSYIHYVAAFAAFFQRSPADLDLDAVRQYLLYPTEERKLSPQSINCFVSAVQFLFLVTLEMPWKKEDFPRPRLDHKLPIVLAAGEVQQFLRQSPAANTAPSSSPATDPASASPKRRPQFSSIDSQRMLNRVDPARGQDRYTMLSPASSKSSVLTSAFTVPPVLALPSWRPHLHFSAGAVQTACRDAWTRSGSAAGHPAFAA
jgi:hypothetical protein